MNQQDRDAWIRGGVLVVSLVCVWTAMMLLAGGEAI